MSIDIGSLLNNVNNVRRSHGAPAVQWDAGIACVSQAWAEHKRYAHSGISNYGENLAKVWVKEADFKTAISLWAKEMDSYNYNSPGFSPTTGHGTALIWKSSTHIGAGLSQLADGSYFDVMNFAPPGNVRSQDLFRQNVTQK
jgi:uncharacterized protein YkwD